MKEIQHNYQLDEHPEQSLELWKWFTDDAAKIKDRMWTMATFFYTLLGGLLGFIGKEFLADDMGIKNPSLVLLTGFLGCILSGYGMYMIRSYGFHIRSGWNRANYIRFHIQGLNKIWDYGDPKATLVEGDSKSNNNKCFLNNKPDHTLPPEAKRLILLMGFFFLIYAGIFLLVQIQSQKTYLIMETHAIINTIIAATIPLLILYFGHRLDKRKREEQEAKQAEQDKIERKHKARIQFELAATFLGPQAGHYIAEVTIILHNKGLVRNMIDDLHLKILGIKQDAKIVLLKGEDHPQVIDRQDEQKAIDQIAKFPETFVDTNILENKGSFFVEPGVVQQFTYVARIPANIRFIFVRSKFKYHKDSTHSAQKVFEVKPMKAPD
ncbi:RipA family octameric membrane protein [Lunatibacter salilacus]|uniref:RipA family octameric membrane protein n=1 Tax=Lunatibacter salilacus TaxID=2483804 RepID=UPI00131E3BA6|nr:hypothetical protein [Lunatibacter salilacus]